MKVYDLLKCIGVTKDILSCVTITLYNPNTEEIIDIVDPTIDDYIHLCDRKILEWTPRDFLNPTKPRINIFVKMKEEDHYWYL